jgi:hypothetical protein
LLVEPDRIKFGEIMTCYTCKRCPLAFQVGYYGYWDLTGCCSQYVCCACGTMHKIEHLNGKPDVLFALAGPIPALVDVIIKDCAGKAHTMRQLPIGPDSWRRIGELPTFPELKEQRIFPKRVSGLQLDRLSCSFCGVVGQLVSHEWPRDSKGNWPQFGDGCPMCGEKLDLEYVDTIN